MVRKILHLDLDAFFCAVEEQRDPSLVGKPFAVGGRPGERGVIASCSYAARAYGVHSAMPTARALKLCPQLILVSGHHHDYGEVSHKVMERLGRITARIEQVSIDEAFLDVSDLPESGLIIAQKLQADIMSELGLPCSIGVASNKLVAKAATDFGKSAKRGNVPPRAIQVVPPGEEAAFLAPLPAQALWGIGPKTAARLAEVGIHTIGDLAQMQDRELVALFGKYGRDLALRARGIDDSPVVTEHELKSISQETTFERDVRDGELILRTLRGQAESVAFRLRQDNLCAVTVKIKLRWPDFSTITRQATLSQATDQDSVILTTAVQLLHQAWQPGKAIRLLGVGVSGLRPSAHQLSLWNDENERERRLLRAVDELRARFGKRAVKRGSDLEDKANR